MADHQQQQQQLVTMTGEMAMTGTAGTILAEEDMINISLDMECNPKFMQWHDSGEEDDEEEPAMSVDPNVMMPPHHEVHFPLARQLDQSLMPLPVLFHMDDTEMASFAIPHVAEQPMSTSSAVEMEMGPVPNIVPLNPEVMIAILDPSILHPGAGISPCVSNIIQQYIEGK